MIGLIKDFALTAVIIILNHWVYGVEDVISYDFIVNIITRYETRFIIASVLGSIVLLTTASAFESLGLYKVTYGMSKVLVRVCQFLITFLSVLNIVFYAAVGSNLMRNNGYETLFALALILGASCWALRIIDFNYHTRNALLPVGALTFMSIILVEIIWPLTNF